MLVPRGRPGWRGPIGCIVLLIALRSCHKRNLFLSFLWITDIGVFHGLKDGSMCPSCSCSCIRPFKAVSLVFVIGHCGTQTGSSFFHWIGIGSSFWSGGPGISIMASRKGGLLVVIHVPSCHNKSLPHRLKSNPSITRGLNFPWCPSSSSQWREAPALWHVVIPPTPSNNGPLCNFQWGNHSHLVMIDSSAPESNNPLNGVPSIMIVLKGFLWITRVVQAIQGCVISCWLSIVAGNEGLVLGSILLIVALLGNGAEGHPTRSLKDFLVYYILIYSP